MMLHLSHAGPGRLRARRRTPHLPHRIRRSLPSGPPAPHSQHPLSPHSLSPHSLSPHSLSPHPLSPHPLSSHSPVAAFTGQAENHTMGRLPGVGAESFPEPMDTPANLPALKRLAPLRTAIVSDSLTVYGGAERVLEQILSVFPKADLFSLVNFPLNRHHDFLHGRPAQTTFIQHLPFATRHFRSYLPLWPLAIEQLDLSGYDLVISSHFAVAHGVITGPSQTHVVYTHSPMRYAWDLQAQYLADSSHGRGIKGALARRALHKIRTWDASAAQRVDRFAANSTFVANRIRKYYRRSSTVIHPPVDIDRFAAAAARERYYVTASRLVPYKRVDLIIEAFNRMPQRSLVVLGDGPELKRLRQMAGPNVSVAGHVDESTLADCVGRAQAFLFAAIEDFGIAPVEAQAAGVPVIALGQGGLLESVRGLGSDMPTGVFFDEQTPEAIIEAVNRFERHRDEISGDDCRRNAWRFRPAAFRHALAEFVWESVIAANGSYRRQARSHPFESTRIVAKPASSSAHRRLARASHRADL